jgi:hypothetical protein
MQRKICVRSHRPEDRIIMAGEAFNRIRIVQAGVVFKYAIQAVILFVDGKRDVIPGRSSFAVQEAELQNNA